MGKLNLLIKIENSNFLKSCTSFGTLQQIYKMQSIFEKQEHFLGLQFAFKKWTFLESVVNFKKQE